MTENSQDPRTVLQADCPAVIMEIAGDALLIIYSNLSRAKL